MSRTSQSPPPVLDDMSRDELLQVAREKEAALHDAEARASTAEKRCTGRHNQCAAQKTPEARTPRADDEEKDPADLARQAGTLYGLTKGMWLVMSAEKTMAVKLDDGYKEETRFAKRTNRIQGELRDVVEVLPEDLHSQRTKTWVADKFKEGLHNQRWNTASRVRHDISAVFRTHIDTGATNEDGTKKEIHAEDLLDSTTRASWAHLIGGKRNRNNKMEYEVFDAPVLHGDFSDSFNAKTFLDSKLVMHVAAAFLYGPSKAVFLATGKGTVSANAVMADIHQITHTTPGLVANAAIYTLWTLSNNNTLRETGTQTGINWQTHHQNILEYLLNGVRQRKAGILKLFHAWDDVLFPDTETGIGSVSGGSSSSAGSGGRRRALDALDAMPSVEPEDEEENETQHNEEQHDEEQHDEEQHDTKD
ncbi:hypothetical protein HMN09_00780200 [Mycena chlorophos]|uniref:Uncharacterized protein n=1 Tax=Mycena chlorophos TaxID=658473 RepID=A0A8H6SWN4_MYCCL|nr:hypothetical protein HMN09_00780200 [Mycena chlorophos]